MNLPCSIYIPGPPLESPSGPPLESLPPANEGNERYVNLPWAAGIDPRLKHLDVRVLFILRGSQWTGKPVEMGRRLIARYACAGQKAVGESLRRLEACGWIESNQGKRGDRARYRVHAVKFAAEVERRPEKVDVPKVKRVLVPCPVCGVRCRQILKVGWCRKCNWKREVGKVVDEKITERIHATD